MTLAVICITTFAYADGKHEILLKEGEKTTQTISVEPLYDLTVEITGQDENRNVHLSILFDNLSPTETMVVFCAKYPETSLNRALIRYDRRFGGTKGKRITESPYPALNDKENYYEIEPGSRTKLLLSSKPMKDNQTYECFIPIYIARSKKCLFTKLVLLEKRVEELSVRVKLAPDVRYLQLLSEVDSLAHAAARDTIKYCKHAGTPHYPTIEKQKATWRAKIDSLNNEIYKELKSRAASEGSVVYAEFDEIFAKLDKIDIDAIPLVEHKVASGCNCPQSIRNMTLAAIYNRLDDLYQGLYTGRKSKESIISEVKALKTHAGHIQKDPKGYKKRIDKYYNLIMSF